MLDAATGTRLIALGLDPNRDDPALWNVDRPESVAELHRRDVASGSEAVYANTFGANRVRLARFGREAEVEPINRAAVALARRAVGPDRFVIGDLGPSAIEDDRAYREQAEILAEAGVDALVLETHTPASAERGLDLLRTLRSALPILVSLLDRPLPSRETLRRFEDRGAVALGANCVLGVENARDICRKLRQSTPIPLLIKPSAGLPDGPFEDPKTFADAVPGWLDAGVRLIGGCCGTTEAHIRAVRLALDRRGPDSKTVGV